MDDSPRGRRVPSTEQGSDISGLLRAEDSPPPRWEADGASDESGSTAGWRDMAVDTDTRGVVAKMHESSRTGLHEERHRALANALH